MSQTHAWFRSTVLTLAMASALTAVEPLREAGEDQRLAQAALAALAQGDTGLIEALPHHLWSSPTALPEIGDPDLSQRWTRLIEAARRRGGQRPNLPPITQGSAAWDRAEDHESLPWLQRAGQRAWDRGQTDLARRILGRAGEAPSLRPWPSPQPAGRGTPLTQAPPDPAAALVATRSWLLGLDPWGQVAWQRRLDLGTRVATSPEAAVLLGPAGCWLIDAEGGRTALPPAPDDALPLAATASAAWFATRDHRWFLDGPHALHLPLTGTPLGPPQVTGRFSRWLDSTSTWLFEGSVLVARTRHGLELGTDARLIGSMLAPGVADGRGGYWRLDGPCEPVITPPPMRPVGPPHLGPAATLPANPQRLPNGTWQWADQHLHLTLDRGRVIVTVTDDRGTIAWETSWTARPYDEAPGRTLVVTANRVVVQEGDLRLTILNRRDGRVLRALDAPGANPSRCTADEEGLVVWQDGSELHLAPAAGPHRQFPAPGSGILIGVTRGVVLAGSATAWWITAEMDPTLLSYPVSTPPPQVLSNGLQWEDAWHPWQQIPSE